MLSYSINGNNWKVRIKVGEPRKPDFANLVMFIFSGFLDYFYPEIKPLLIDEFGEIDYESKTLDFGKFTFYYKEEMGGDLKGRLISFKELIHPHEIVNVKLKTLRIERIFSVEGKRKVNIDPGYINNTQFVLSTTKHWGNRIYLSKGIYAEVTLMFVNGHFVPFEHTYPNYKTKEYIEELEKIRNIYKSKRKQLLKKLGG